MCAGRKRELADSAPDLPWACNKEALNVARECCDIMTDSSLFDPTICIPSEF